MEKNKLLSFTKGFINLAYGFAIGMIVLIAIGFVHWHFQPDFYSGVNITMNESGFAVYNSTTEVPSTLNMYFGSSARVIQTTTLSEVAKPAVYFMVVKYLAVMVLLVLILKELKKFIASVSKAETFNYENSRVFRKVGLLVFVMFLISAVSWLTLQDGFTVFKLNFNLYLFAFMLFAFILSEVFREGHRLQEENQLTI